MSKKIAVTALLLVGLLFTIFPTTHAVDNNVTIVQIDPPSIMVMEIGKTFSINVTIANVTGLCAWDFKLYYISTILSCTDAAEGPFLQTGGSTHWAENITNTYNSTHGRVRFGSTLLGQVPGVNGSGVLATITFQTQFGGDTVLDLDDTQLYTCDMPPHSIDHETIDGDVQVGMHDVAITHVNPHKTVLGQGFSASLTVTTENQGVLPETFNVTLYANTTEIERREVTLLSGASTVLIFIWDATGFVKDAYTISAEADAVPGETDLADNTYTDGTVAVSIPCDVADSTTPPAPPPDGRVDYKDLFWLLLAYGSDPTKPHWDPNCDFAGSTTTPPTPPDNRVDYKDLFWMLLYYGTVDP